jgi:hypothetical protein
MCADSVCPIVYVIYQKPKGQLRMDNPEKLTTLGTTDTGRRKRIQITQQKQLKRRILD